jgi:hypothetical protein
MTVKEMLKRIGSQEISDWAAIFAIEDEELEKQNKKIQNNQVGEDDEDITDALIASIEADKLESGD